MKTLMKMGAVMALVLMLGLPYVQAQQQQGPPQGSGWMCPMMGQGGGMMHHGGMMQHGSGMGCCAMMNRNPSGAPLTKEQAKQVVDDYVRNTNNPNIKVGEVAEKGDVFEATVVTKEGSLVEKIQIDKNTGWFRRAS